MKNINFYHIPYIIIIILLIVITCQSGKEKVVVTEVIKRDTVTKYVYIRDTIKGKTIYVKGKPDTSWVKKENYVPKDTYTGLLEQYKTLGNTLFKKNYFETRYNIKNYGYVIVKDSISENWLQHTELTTFLNIPEKTITITEKAPPRTQLYVGLILTGDKVQIMNSASVGLLLKDKKDRLYGGSVGINSRGTQFGVSSYLKIKVKK